MPGVPTRSSTTGGTDVAVEAYYRPTSIEEALDLSVEHESSLEVISGGTLTMPP